MEKRLNKEEVEKIIEDLGIDYNEFWVLSTGSLVLRGLYHDAGDVDIAVTEKGLDELKSKYNLILKDNGWYIVNDKVECVLDMKDDSKVERFGKYNLQRVEKYYDFMISTNREKDKKKIELLKKYLNK